jgi:two-component system, OmpR family, sensor kinase
MTVLVTVLAMRAVLLDRLADRIEQELAQEAEELRTLASGNDPDTGQPFGEDVERILEVFFRRNIPLRHEVMLGFVGDRLVVQSGERAARTALRDPALLARFVDQPDAVRADAATDLGRLAYLAVPLRGVDGTAAGTFVVAVFEDLARAEVDDVVRVAGFVAAIALLSASALAIGLAGRILGPVRVLGATAQQITDQDLSRRIPVEGADELGQLAGVVNRMLDRLEGAFADQRRFLDDTGHELRTPLTIIRGHLEVMGDDPDELPEVRALVLDEVGRMQRIVEDLILLAKARRPDFLRPAPVDVAALTREVHAKAEALADGITWRLGAVAAVVVTADRDRLTQAVVQLAGNAASHCPAGTTVTIGSALRRSPDPAVVIEVADDGPGIAAEDVDQVFERFHRGRRARSSVDGSGLGLSIVRAIAEAHGGRAELDSRLGVGTTVRLVLPVEEVR